MRRRHFVYFFGDLRGEIVKTGETHQPLYKRRAQVTRELHRDLCLLAAVEGTRANQDHIEALWQPFRASEFMKGDTFQAVPEVVEYVNWLRQQWFTTINEDDPVEDVVSFNLWMPTQHRRVSRPPIDSTRLFPLERAFHGDLAGTAWDWMATPEPIGNDFYTPVEIVDAARAAMGGIDLDPASHWRANRKLRIPTYYHLHRSAFDNPWFGRVWLNPPYGENDRWFARMVEVLETGNVEQICMISPAWAFGTQIALPLMRRFVTASVLLVPTPKFWGNPNNREGTNHPHLLIYIGDRVTESSMPSAIWECRCVLSMSA